MTPQEERAALALLADQVEDAALAAYERLVRLIRDGIEPREAVAQALEGLSQEASAALQAALTTTLVTAAAAELPAASVALSTRLYAQAGDVSATVSDIVHRYTQGVQDARALALRLFEGYGFREPGAEPLQFNPRNDELPKYLRELLRASPGIERDVAKAFASLQVDKLSTPALRAAYSGVLEALDKIEAGSVRVSLENRIKVAFFERMRFFANRIAQTETHRAYMREEARRLMADADVEFVQLRRAPGRQTPCICALYTQRDRYGLGPGVYPKARAPRPPLHPFCRCVLSPRLDLTGRKAKPEDTDADVYLLQRLGEPVAARIMGSRAKLDLVMRGAIPDDVHNAATSPAYRVKLAGEGV